MAPIILLLAELEIKKKKKSKICVVTIYLTNILTVNLCLDKPNEQTATAMRTVHYIIKTNRYLIKDLLTFHM